MFLLLLQAAQSTLPPNAQSGVATEIAVHPYIALIIIVGLFGALMAVIKISLVFLEGRVNDKFAAIDALGASESKQTNAAIERIEKSLLEHARKEEEITWPKIDSLGEAMNAMQLSNETAHSDLAISQAILTTRMDSVESKMPNGELTRLANAFEELSREYRRNG